MLIEFAVNGWRMFPEAMLSMVAAEETGDQHPGLRRVALIYGANGSGKSALVEALRTFRDHVTAYSPQKLPETAQRFEVVIETGGRTFLYAAAFRNLRVHAEELVDYTFDHDRVIFKRNEATQDQDVLPAGYDSFPDTAANMLMLRKLAGIGGVNGVREVMTWFQQLRIFSQDYRPIIEPPQTVGQARLRELATMMRWAMKQGDVVVVDDLDLHMHPVAVQELVKMMQHAEQGQLIATTNAVHLLNESWLHRDQLWFIEQRRNGTSELYSLEEFPDDDAVLAGRDIMTNYLTGRCGGIPFQQDLHQIHEDGLEDGCDE